MEEILNIYKVTISGYWWIIAPVALFFILKNIWLNYRYGEFLKNLKWVMLEVKFPQDTTKSPKAIEQFFSGLHAVEKKLKFKDKYIKCELPTWFSVELISKEGTIHIFVRTQEKFRNLVESHIYSQYPDAEISEAEDYVSELPKGIPNQEYDVWGTELLLTKPDAYPIRTYPVFFEEREAEERNDPIAGLFEFLSSLDSQEHVWIQILVSPTGDDWKKQGEKLVDELMSKKAEVKKGGLIGEEASSWFKTFIDGIVEFLFGIFGESKEEKESEARSVDLSPGKKEVVLAIEKNIAKLGFKTIIRYIYWTKKDSFSKDKTAAIGGFWKQFNTQNLNGFKPNKKVTPGWAKIFKLRREKPQKRIFVQWYKKRYFSFKDFSQRGFVFNIEELATIFHIPIKFVKAERIPRIEAKKGGPPAGLPIEQI